MIHLVPAGHVGPLPQLLASGDLLVQEGLPSGEAPVPEGLAVRPLVPHMAVLPEGLELPQEVASFLKYFPFSDTKRPNKLQQENVRIHMLVKGKIAHSTLVFSYHLQMNVLWIFRHISIYHK